MGPFVIFYNSVQKNKKINPEKFPFEAVQWGLFNVLAVNIASKYFPKECAKQLRRKGPYIAFDRNIVSCTDVYTRLVQMMEKFQSGLILLKYKSCQLSAFPLLLEQVTHAPASGSLNLPFPLTRMLFPQLDTWPTSCLHSGVCLKVTLPNKLYLTTLYKMSYSIANFFSLLFFFIKFLHCHHLTYFWSVLFLSVSPHQNVRFVRTGMLSVYLCFAVSSAPKIVLTHSGHSVNIC